MVEHVFGGDWTQEKLARLRAYLVAYRSIFENNQKARFFTTWYVDAFAGTGSFSKGQHGVSPELSFGEETFLDADKAHFLDGSAKIALGIPSPFHKYLFIEGSKRRADALITTVAKEFPSLASRVEIRNEDANTALCEWCKARDWTRERAVVFLDPYGMQVNWSTVSAVAATKGVDLWYLVPFITRLLRNDGNLDESWGKRLDSLFGTSEWRNRFYPTQTQDALFGPVETSGRDATEQNIQSFIEERLATCFVKVAKSRILRNSKSSPLFALCFAASNDRGAEPALRIAQYLLKN